MRESEEGQLLGHFGDRVVDQRGESRGEGGEERCWVDVGVGCCELGREDVHRGCGGFVGGVGRRGGGAVGCEGGGGWRGHFDGGAMGLRGEEREGRRNWGGGEVD